MSQPAHTVRPPGSPPTGQTSWFFRPFPSLPERWRSPLAQDQLLSEYLTHHTNFAHFASTRGITVDQLFDWLHSEEVVDRKKRMEHMADDRAALIARLARPAAIDTLARTMLDPSALPKERRLAASALLRVTVRRDGPSSPTDGGGEALRAGRGSVSISSSNSPSCNHAPCSAASRSEPRPLRPASRQSDTTRARSKRIEPPSSATPNQRSPSTTRGFHAPRTTSPPSASHPHNSVPASHLKIGSTCPAPQIRAQPPMGNDGT